MEDTGATRKLSVPPVQPVCCLTVTHSCVCVCGVPARQFCDPVGCPPTELSAHTICPELVSRPTGKGSVPRDCPLLQTQHSGGAGPWVTHSLRPMWLQMGFPGAPSGIFSSAGAARRTQGRADSHSSVYHLAKGVMRAQMKLGL